MRLVGQMLKSSCLQQQRPPRRVVHSAVGRLHAGDTRSAAATEVDGDLRQVAPWRAALLKTYSHGLADFSLSIRLKGVSFDNRQVLLQQLQPGQGVLFCREPSCPADPNAVGVYTPGMQHLGYVPKHAAQTWQLQTCFGSVGSVGRAKGNGLWGAQVLAKPSVYGLCCDLLPEAWQDKADLQQALGPEKWQQVQQQVLERYSNRCAISSMPASQLEQPLQIVPQWRFDYITRQVQLAHVIPMCQPLYALTQQLDVAADALAAVSPELQLLQDVPDVAGPGSADASGALAADILEADDAHVAAISSVFAERQAAQANTAAAAAASLAVEQQEAVRWFGQLMQWQLMDCVQYIAYAGWRRRHLLLEEGWQLEQLTAERVAAVVRTPAAVEQHHTRTAPRPLGRPAQPRPPHAAQRRAVSQGPVEAAL